MALNGRIARKLPRSLKAGRQWVRALAAGGRPLTRVVFVLGTQRSGTRLPLEALDCSPDVATYSEGSSPFFDRVLLEPLDVVERAVQRSPFPVVALKPICESHRVQELLDRFTGSRAIWIFRNYRDTVNSTSVKWRSGREALRDLVRGAASWRSGGLAEDKIRLARGLYRDDMTLHEANAVMWFLRTGLFFDLGAHLRPDVLLVKYEDLVTQPDRGFARMFDFIDVPTPSSLSTVLRSSSSSTRPFPDISLDILTRCDNLQKRLLAFYNRTVQVAP